MTQALLQKVLKTPNWLLYAALSAIFLVLGARAGVVTAGWMPLEGTRVEEEASTIGSPADYPLNGQRNLLVIGVDRLDRDAPRLESLWLFLYFPGRSPATLLPLFPGTERTVDAPETPLAAAFSLDPSGNPSPAFFERLQREKIWWSGFVLLDETALVALLDGLGGVDLDGKTIPGLRAIEMLSAARRDPSGPLPAQVRLLRSACSRAGNRISSWGELADLAGTLGSHLRTDLEIAGLVREWLQAAGAEPAFECEFPLLPAP
jgi:hypothetical protein